MADPISKATKPLKTKETPSSDNGQKPQIEEIEKAITILELQTDLAGLEKGLLTLQQQAIAQSGAIQYIRQKLEQAEKEGVNNAS